MVPNFNTPGLGKNKQKTRSCEGIHKLEIKKTVLSIYLLKIWFLETLYTKFQLPYIAKLIQSGTWFDGSKSLIMKTQELEPDYAPNYILQNPTNFKQLLQP